MRTKDIFLLLVIVFGTVFRGYSGEETLDTYLKTDQLDNGAVLKLHDPKIYKPTGYDPSWSNEFGIKQTRNAIELFLNTDASDFGEKAFSLAVDLKLTYKDASDKVVQNSRGKDTTYLSLNVNYDKSRDYKNRDIHAFSGAHKMFVEVEDVRLNGADTTSLTDVVFLRSFIKVERYYKMKNRKVNQLKHQYRRKDNELEIRWDDKKGAVWYEVEWTFVNNYDHNNGNIQRKSKQAVSYDFEKNSQRIRTRANSYRIPVVYNEGYLVYRVRPVAKGGTDYERLKYGRWSIVSSDKVSAVGSNSFRVSAAMAHSGDKMNWQYKATYTERGDGKSLVNYFDGLNFKRQQVEQLHSENNVIISEQMYDYRGRQTIDVLPAPKADKNPHPNLKYYNSFNTDRQGNPYSKDDFDDVSGCKPTPSPMSKSSGAARYYSSNNKMTNIFKEHLPKSEGYPFTQTQYMPDKSENVWRISKPGKQYQIGKGHAVEKFNGTPHQAVLDRLFGSEVGNAGSYRRRIISDENGQLRVQYINEEGKPIATALAGDKPKALEKLPADQVKSLTITTDMLKSHQRVRTNSLTAANKINVTTEGSQYSFNYSVNPSTFNRYVCEGEQICYDGIYNLRIRLTDDCGDVVKDTAMQIGSVKNIDEQCNDNQSVNLTFSSGPLSVGTYQITKRLELNEQALQKYLDIFSQKSCIQKTYDTLLKKNREKMDTVECNAGCGNTGVIQKKYEYTTEDGKTYQDELSDAQYQRLKQQQNNLCGGGMNACQNLYDILLGDISPGGQYALYYDSINQEANPWKFKLSVLNDSTNVLPENRAHWRNPHSIYKDGDGNRARIKISRIKGIQGVLDTSKIFVHQGDSVIYPQNLLKVSDFIDLWKSSWAKSLLPYHPEYGYYLYCKQYPASNQYDSRLMSTGKYKKAIDSGYVKADGTTKLLSDDPYFNNHPQLKQKMQDTLANFVAMTAGDTLSLKEMVIAIHNGCAPVKCGTGSLNMSKMRQCIKNNSPLFAGKDTKTQNQEWGAYKAIYLALKRKIKSPERHQFAINHGYYNGCIGLKDSLKYMNQSSGFFNGKPYQNSSNFNKQRSCFLNAVAYAGKDIRFADGDDIYKYIDGLENMDDKQAQAAEMENYADYKMKSNCGKCPVEGDLETLLNGLTQNGNITGNQDATGAVTSCDIKNQMNAANMDYFSWKASVSGRELTGKLMAQGVNVATIKMYDTTQRKLNWNNVVLFTCLQHTTQANHYNPSQAHNFKIRAITTNNEAFWLEGKVSKIDLTDCDVEKFCTKNAIAGEIQSLFHTVLGLAPMVREVYVNNGYQQMADSLLPEYKNTKIIGEITAHTLSEQMKNQHKYPNSFEYYWIVDTLMNSGRTLKAGIYEAKKLTSCPFEFEMLDSTKQFGQPIFIDKIHLNHPAIEQTSCDATQFVLEVRQLKSQQNDGFYLSRPQFGGFLSQNRQYTESFYIKVTNECYSIGECCPESKCPDIAENGGFGAGNSKFSSDLAYDKSGRKANYYKVFPSSDDTAGKMLKNIPVDDLDNLNGMNFDPAIFSSGDTASQGNNLINPNNLNTETLTNFTGLADTTGSGQVPNPKFIDPANLPDLDGDTSNQMARLQIQALMQKSQDMLQLIGNMSRSMHETSKSTIRNIRGGGQDSSADRSPQWKAERDTVWTTFPGFGEQQKLHLTGKQVGQFGMLPKGSLKKYLNKYLVFKVSDMKEREVWKQYLNLKKANTYGFKMKVKRLVKAIPHAEGQFSLKVGNQKKSLQYDESQGQWKVFSTYFTAGSNGSQKVALVFKPEHQNPQVGYQKWGVDDIVIKPQSCEQMACCPPLSPTLPDDSFENPCKAKKEMIAEANTEKEFEEFLQDTLSGIEASYRNDVMNVQESFTMTFTDNYYDYTLYYYDQSGNLVKNVPPKGFNPLSMSKVQQVQSNRQQNGNNPVYPNHKMVTRYQFNSYDEMVSKKSPDEGKTRYWYDELGRLVAEQSNAQKQRGSVYTYHLYDAMNRKVEIGEVKALSPLVSTTARDYAKFENWVMQGSRNQVMHKYYDSPINTTVDNYFPDGQKNLRKRVASIIYEEKWDNKKSSYDFATHFSYNAHGSVSFLVKENTKFPQPHQVKKIDYDFDIISQDLRSITYQPGQKDQFIQKYKYDADNRLSKVLTSPRGLHWEEDAKYYYYPHGKLARVELGDEKVQGMDFAYTLQGWLKGVNGADLKPASDAGKDAAAKGPFRTVARDVFSMILDYNDNDYASIGPGNQFSSHLSGPLGNSSPELYNSDVRQMIVNNGAFSQKKGLAMDYKYDQLGRLVESNTFTKTNSTWQSATDYETSYSYDENGNLIGLKRNGNNGTMDNLTFNYRQNNNRLGYVADQVSESKYPNDIDNQKKSNYMYDASGRVRQNLAAGLQNIEWTRNDRVKSAVKWGYGNIYNYYDGTGFRVMKDYMPTDNSGNKVEMFVRGVNNELLAKYRYDANEDSTYLAQQYIHGKSRLGVYEPDTTLQSIKPGHIGQYRGKKQYELGNHLDNVMVTISDRKISDTAAAPTSAKYQADIVSATGYYPYGAQLPGRKMNTGKYAHGFQGKEKDDKLKGEGNSYYFKERIYDPRIGRWLSVDSKAGNHPGVAPYIAMNGDPVNLVDPDGADPICSDCPNNQVEMERGKFGDYIVKEKMTTKDSYEIQGGSEDNEHIVTEVTEKKTYSYKTRFSEDVEVKNKEAWVKTEKTMKTYKVSEDGTRKLLNKEKKESMTMKREAGPFAKTTIKKGRVPIKSDAYRKVSIQNKGAVMGGFDEAQRANHAGNVLKGYITGEYGSYEMSMEDGVEYEDFPSRSNFEEYKRQLKEHD
ncbi:MAG: RHS repeat-associated core domain-containing protein [Bacteroidales bacterium]|nr:RHS repeat-associated core domain-containing protein [Bacteroidales bacterium]MCF8337798.1 RHS repeat-associated core domain-containing protein [Bacteroidales bacterium]